MPKKTWFWPMIFIYCILSLHQTWLEISLRIGWPILNRLAYRLVNLIHTHFCLFARKKSPKWKTSFPLCPPCIIVVPEMTQKVHQMFIVLRFQVSILPNKKRVNLLECRKDILLEKYHVMDQRRWVEIITMQYYVGLTNTWTWIYRFSPNISLYCKMTYSRFPIRKGIRTMRLHYIVNTVMCLNILARKLFKN